MLQAVAKKAFRVGGAVLLGAACLLAGSPSWSRDASPLLEESSTVALADLPVQGQATYELILAGGPFPYDKDGSVFGNRERILPAQKRGFYREYTVKTPRSRDRGARRIICGGKQPQRPDACYYTSDHYSSFRKITP